MQSEIQHKYMENLRDELSDDLVLRTSWQGRGVDGVLQNIVDLANDIGLTMSITLNIGGSLVSGTLISSDEYYQEIITGFSGRAADPANTAAAALVKRLKELKPSKGDPTSPQFIHLRSAHHYNGSQAVPDNGTLWRGKISAVDGFFFGTLHTG